MRLIWLHEYNSLTPDPSPKEMGLIRLEGFKNLLENMQRTNHIETRTILMVAI